MNVYKPLMIANITQSITLLSDGCTNFRKFLIEGTQPHRKKIEEYVERSLMLVTALAPVIGYDKASKIAHHANEHDLTLKEAALDLAQLAQFEASFWILSRVALNQIKELSAQKCLHRRVVTTKVVDVSRCS